MISPIHILNFSAGEHVKQKAGKSPKFICFVKDDKTNVFRGLGVNVLHNVHRSVHELNFYGRKALKGVKNMVRRLFMSEYMNVYEGYRSLIAIFALSLKRLLDEVKQNYFASPFASPFGVLLHCGGGE